MATVYGAYIALTCFYDGVDIHTMLAEKDSRRTTSLQEIRTRVNELCSYLTANETRLINYGKEHREGNPISTARVESTVNQLVDWRMEKKQHMRWTSAVHRCCSMPAALCSTENSANILGGRRRDHPS